MRAAPAPQKFHLPRIHSFLLLHSYTVPNLRRRMANNDLESLISMGSIRRLQEILTAGLVRERKSWFQIRLVGIKQSPASLSPVRRSSNAWERGSGGWGFSIIEVVMPQSSKKAVALNCGRRSPILTSITASPEANSRIKHEIINSAVLSISLFSNYGTPSQLYHRVFAIETL